LTATPNSKDTAMLENQAEEAARLLCAARSGQPASPESMNTSRA